MEYDKSELLEETYKLVRANNKILRSMRRRAWVGSVVKVIFWALMVGVPAWLYYQYAQPLMGQLMDTIGQVQGASAQLQQIGGGLQQLNQGTTGDMFKLLNSIPGLQMPGGQ